jgi:arsenite methyltransferase
MNTPSELKQIVKDKYSEIAEVNTKNTTTCCTSSCGCNDDVTSISMQEDYSAMHGYVKDADLGLGCGLPTSFARIRKGDIVLDLGSGAGNDAFVARAETGPEGKVIGVDMTEKMVSLARRNAEKLGYHNVEFRLGDIEDLPVNDYTIDVVVSNCVLNLVPDKRKAFREAFRVLKAGGHFSVSDIVTRGVLPAGVRADAEMYAGCVAGAIEKDDYLNIVKEAGFTNITVQKEKQISLPDSTLSAYLNDSEMADYKNGRMGLYSITLYAEKPLLPSNVAETKGSKSWWDPGCCN